MLQQQCSSIESRSVLRPEPRPTQMAGSSPLWVGPFVVVVIVVGVSVMGSFLWDGVASYTPNPESGGPGGLTCQGLKPHASIASSVLETREPPHHWAWYQHRDGIV